MKKNFTQRLVDLGDEVSIIADDLRAEGIDPMQFGETEIDDLIMDNADRDVQCYDSEYYYDYENVMNVLRKYAEEEKDLEKHN